MQYRSHVDVETKGYRYYRNAVERHWDPHDIPLDQDRDRIARFNDPGFDAFRRPLALFGAGEQAVTEDLAPLATVIEDVNDQLFIATQLYEEAKHTDFFDRYWRTVINAEEDRRGLTRSTPYDDRWFNDAYIELFDRNQRAMDRLLVEDTPETRAIAYCHYHLTIEGILAQTGYYGLQTSYSPDTVPELPHLPGLYDGLSGIRSDEGRHVGFGMSKLKALVKTNEVTPDLLHDTLNDLLPLVNETVQPPDPPAGDHDPVGPTPEELVEYAADKHLERMNQITNAAESIPSVDELTTIDT